MDVKTSLHSLSHGSSIRTLSLVAIAVALHATQSDLAAAYADFRVQVLTLSALAGAAVLAAVSLRPQTMARRLGLETAWLVLAGVVALWLSVVEVTALERGARFAFTGVTGPFTAHNTYTFESVPGGTKVTDSAESELSGPLRLIDPLVGRMMHRQFVANLAALKDRLEAQAATSVG